MKNDTLRQYVGQLVRITTHLEDREKPVYYAKVSDYDSDFVTLNPFLYGSDVHDDGCNPTRTDHPLVKDINKFAAGTTNKDITISRKGIKTIERVV